MRVPRSTWMGLGFDILAPLFGIPATIVILSIRYPGMDFDTALSLGLRWAGMGAVLGGVAAWYLHQFHTLVTPDASRSNLASWSLLLGLLVLSTIASLSVMGQPASLWLAIVKSSIAFLGFEHTFGMAGLVVLRRLVRSSSSRDEADVEP